MRRSKFFVGRTSVVWDATIKRLADPAIFYAPHLWRGGYIWASQQPKSYPDVFLRHGYLYSVPRGYPHPRKATIEKYMQDTSAVPATGEELIPFYEWAWFGNIPQTTL